MENKLAIIEQCIQNDKRAITELEYHLAKLYEMRDEELAKQGIDKEEWEEAVRRLMNEV